MALRRIPDTDLSYHLIHFDRHGDELLEPGDTSASVEVVAAVRDGVADITDVLLLSHGWHGDVAGAMNQYDNWVLMMAENQPEDFGREFRPLVVGLHWPSLAWGNDTIVSGSGDGLLGGERPADAVTVGEAVDRYAELVADTPKARDALHTIFEATLAEDDAETIPDEVRLAYLTLRREAGLDDPADDEVGTGADWDPVEIYDRARAETEEDPGLLGRTTGDGLLGWSFVDRLRDAILSPLRQLSFWTMKARARTFGENGAAQLLRQLQKAAPDARFHLMGHSFGSLVVTAAVSGGKRDGKRGVPLRPVDSLLLVQGALSLWAYAATVPDETDPGYFSRVIRDGLVRGPIVTTRSAFDYAVGRFYPLGAGIAGQVLLGSPLPRFGALGAFGIQGVDEAEDVPIGDESTRYGLEPGRVYNVEATSVISTLDGPGGAHNDIAHPATANLAWQAVLGAP